MTEEYPEPMEEEKRREIEFELDLDEGKIDKYWKSGQIKFVEDYPPYIRFRRPLSGVEKGTVVFFKDGKFDYARGYPKIPRIFMLERGLKKQFDSKIYVEEKLDGYNVRLAKVFDKIKALTRGGLDCPYTNEKMDKSKYEEFFSENPDLMLCGEMIGPKNPYKVGEYPEERELGYYVFDIRHRKKGVPLGVEDKKEILEEYGIKRVNEVGQYEPDEGKELLDKVREMGEEDREGVVLKSKDTSKLMKYTANQSTNSELNYAFKFWNDYGIDFMFRRIVREGFQAYEKGLEGKELEEEASELGKNILIPLVRTIERIDKGEEVTEDFSLRVPTREFGDAFVEYLNHIGINAEITDHREVEDEVEIDVSRKYQSTKDKTEHYLDGNTAKE